MQPLTTCDCVWKPPAWSPLNPSGLLTHGVEVKSLTDAQYNQWIEIAKKSSYAEFAKDVPDGKKLIDEALSVK